MSGWRVKGAKRHRLAGAARSVARTRARRGEPLTRQERATLADRGRNKGLSRWACPRGSNANVCRVCRGAEPLCIGAQFRGREKRTAPENRGGEVLRVAREVSNRG